MVLLFGEGPILYICIVPFGKLPATGGYQVFESIVVLGHQGFRTSEHAHGKPVWGWKAGWWRCSRWPVTNGVTPGGSGRSAARKSSKPGIQHNNGFRQIGIL